MRSHFTDLPAPPDRVTGWPWHGYSSGERATGPLVSIITPSYNQSEFLEATIRSVLLQDYDNLEYIVVDGASTDGTLDILDSYRSAVSTIISEPDRGPADALDKGFSLATGQILAWLNSDDLLLPGAVRRALGELEENPSVDLVHGNRLIIDHRGRCTGFSLVSAFPPSVLWRLGSWIHQETAFFRRSAFEKAGAMNVGELPLAFDYELFLRMKMSGTRFRRLNVFLSAYRQHPDTLSQVKKDELRASVLRYRQEHLLEGPAARSITALCDRIGPLIFALRKIEKHWWLLRQRVMGKTYVDPDTNRRLPSTCLQLSKTTS